MKYIDLSQDIQKRSLISIAQGLRRRIDWFISNLTIARFFNLILLSVSFLLRLEKSLGVPAVLKVDMSPLCNLKCPACVHSKPGGNDILQRQNFGGKQKLLPDDFQKIIDEVGSRVSAVSLYMLGDPLMYPQLAVIARIAAVHNINVHISTNFSFHLSDKKLNDLVESGITSFTVCLDGFSQRNYSKTRIGGDVELVKSNLKRLMKIREQVNPKRFKVEVQFIKFQHNLDELQETREFLAGLGVDQLSHFWGDIHNYADINPGAYNVITPRDSSILPKCFWPFWHMAIRNDGEVLACPNYRIAEFHANQGDARPLGNVLIDGVAKVWNSERYRIARQSTIKAPTDDNKQFCFGCKYLYKTDIDLNIKAASDFHLDGTSIK